MAKLTDGRWAVLGYERNPSPAGHHAAYWDGWYNLKYLCDEVADMMRKDLPDWIFVTVEGNPMEIDRQWVRSTKATA